MFDEARDNNSVLMLDDAGSLLPEMDLPKPLGSMATTDEEGWVHSQLAHHKLSHGDIAALLRRYAATNAKPSAV